MLVKVLEEVDLSLMLDFVDDENTKYAISDLKKYIEKEDNYGFIAKDNDKVIGFAYGYVLLKPDGRKAFYFDSIDVMKDCQKNGVGTVMMKFVADYARQIGCYEMFLVTNKSNVSACRCYEKSGGVKPSDDDVVYVFDENL